MKQTLSFFAEMFICLFLLACCALFVKVRNVHECILTVYDGEMTLLSVVGIGHRAWMYKLILGENGVPNLQVL